MKFKKHPGHDIKTIKPIRCENDPTDTLEVATRLDGKKGLYLKTSPYGILMSRAKALKLAWAIIDELNPSVMTI